MKVLVADDSKPIRDRLVERLLRLPDVQVAEAVDTPDALRQMKSFEPDVAVLDIRMPGGGGIKALDSIKQSHPHVTVMMMTNYPYAQYRRKCLEAGADFFFDKSTEFEQVAESIRQLMHSGDVSEVAHRTASAQLVVAKEEYEKVFQRQRDMSILSLLHKPSAANRADSGYAMWEKTFDSIPDLVAILDAGHTIVRVNKAMADRLNLPAAELTGKKCFEYMHGAICPVRGCPHEALLKDHKEHEFEIYDEHLGGWFEVSVSPIFDKDELIGAIHIAHDMTHRKTAEDSILRARDVAEEANRAKTQFLANMSHELRTPLNAVIGLSELLMDSPLNTEQLDYVQTINTSGEDLLKIIADLLDLSKIEMGKLKVKVEPFAIRGVVEKSIALLASFAEEKGIELSVVVDASVQDQITGDVDRLQQVLINLLNNAIKFTEKGFVRLRVEECITPAGSRCVEFLVEDSGCGMDAETLKRIFEPFQQGDSSTTREYGGSGLGLAISKNLVEMMGGAIQVKSVTGEGSVFNFHIVDQAASQHPVAVLDVRDQWRGRSACVWGDDPADMRVAEVLLERIGIMPRYAESLEIINNRLTHEVAADVVLCSLDMPGLQERLLEFRKVRPEVPWIGFSNWMTPIDEQVKNCFSGFIDRPLNPEQLYGVLMNISESKT